MPLGIAIDGAFFEPLVDILPSYFTNLAISPSAFDGSIIQSPSHGFHFSTEGHDRFIVGFIISNEWSDEAIAKLCTSMPEALRTDSVFNYEPNATTNEILLGWTNHRLSATFDALVASYATSNLAVSTMRKRVHELEHTLLTVEKTFLDLGQPSATIILRWKPVGVFVSEFTKFSAVDEAIHITQRVSVRIGNLLYIDFFMNRGGQGLRGEMCIRATKAYSRRVLINTTVELASLHHGWNQIACGEDETNEREPVDLEVNISGQDRFQISLALSARNPQHAECAHVQGRSLAAPLAIQMWTGVFGINLKRNALAIGYPKDGGTLTKVREIPSWTLRSAKIVHLAIEDPGFRPVEYDDFTRALLLHPLGLAPTIVKLSDLRLPGLKRVSAKIELRRDDAEPVEFALFVAASSVRNVNFNSDDPNDLSVGIEWHLLMASERGEIQCEISVALPENVDIYLLTRNRTSNFHNSWAYVASMDVEIE